MDNNDKNLLTVAQYALLYRNAKRKNKKKYSPARIYQLIEEGKIQPTWIGDRMFVSLDKNPISKL